MEDQTAHIVQSTLQGVAKIAAAASGLPASSIALQSAPKGPVVSFADWLEAKQSSMALCSAATRLRLAQKDALVDANEISVRQSLSLMKSVTKQEKVVEELNSAAEEGKKKLAAMAENDPGRDAQAAAVKTATAAADAAQKQLETLKKSQQALTEASSNASNRLVNARKELTLTTVTNFSPEPAEWTGNAIKAPALVSVQLGGAKEALKAWMDENAVRNYCKKNVAMCTDEWPGNALKVLYAEAALYPPFTELAATPPPQSGSVIYRQPVRTWTFVCKEAPCLDEAGKLRAQQKDILLTSAVDVPQLGVLASLPLRNTAFQNNTLTASFAETGALIKLSYVTNASAAAAADTFTSSADVFLKYKDAMRTEESSALEQPKAQVDARTALLKAQLEEEKAKVELANFLKSNANSSTAGVSDSTP